MNKRNRPYSGQPQTYNGERGSTEVKGLTMRDIADCFVMAMLDSVGAPGMDPELYKKVKNGTWEYNDLYKIKDANKIDPIAVSQNLICEIEVKNV